LKADARCAPINSGFDDGRQCGHHFGSISHGAGTKGAELCLKPSSSSGHLGSFGMFWRATNNERLSGELDSDPIH
jgi:hypothetical protein